MASFGPDGSLPEICFGLERNPGGDLPIYGGVEMTNTGWTSHCECMKDLPMDG